MKTRLWWGGFFISKYTIYDCQFCDPNVIVTLAERHLVIKGGNLYNAIIVLGNNWAIFT